MKRQSKEHILSERDRQTKEYVEATRKAVLKILGEARKHKEVNGIIVEAADIRSAQWILFELGQNTCTAYKAINTASVLLEGMGAGAFRAALDDRVLLVSVLHRPELGESATFEAVELESVEETEKAYVATAKEYAVHTINNRMMNLFTGTLAQPDPKQESVEDMTPFIFMGQEGKA